MDIKLILQKQKCIFAGMYLILFLSALRCMHACICVQALNILVAMGFTIQNPYVQFFTNQSQLWIFIAIAYLISRISLTLKGIKEIKNHGADWD